MRQTRGRSAYIPQRKSSRRLGHAPTTFATSMTTTRAGVDPLMTGKERRLKCAALGLPSNVFGHRDASQSSCTSSPRPSHCIASDTVSGTLVSRQHLLHLRNENVFPRPVISLNQSAPIVHLATRRLDSRCFALQSKPRSLRGEAYAKKYLRLIAASSVLVLESGCTSLQFGWRF